MVVISLYFLLFETVFTALVLTSNYHSSSLLSFLTHDSFFHPDPLSRSSSRFLSLNLDVKISSKMEISSIFSELATINLCVPFQGSHLIHLPTKHILCLWTACDVLPYILPSSHFIASPSISHNNIKSVFSHNHDHPNSYLQRYLRNVLKYRNIKIPHATILKLPWHPSLSIHSIRSCISHILSDMHLPKILSKWFLLNTFVIFKKSKNIKMHISNVRKFCKSFNENSPPALSYSRPV